MHERTCLLLALASGFSQRRADSSTGNSQLRETEFTENQDIIEYHIRKYHHNRVQSQRLGLCRTYKEGAEHHHDEREEEPVHTPMNITFGCIINMRTRYTRLVKPFPERAERLFAKSEEVAKERYEHLQKLVELYK